MKFSYANDYEIVGRLKRLADNQKICLPLVHHARKQQADDSIYWPLIMGWVDIQPIALKYFLSGR